jgi:hypothetical protein
MSTTAAGPDYATLPIAGLLPVEVGILRAWLIDHASEYDPISYNVRVGKGNDPGPTFDARMRAMGIKISQKRIDAVAVKNGDTTLIEVKNRFTLKDVGQIVSYRILWKQDNPLAPDPILLAVASSFDQDALTVLAAHNIQTYLQPVNPALVPARKFKRR